MKFGRKGAKITDEDEKIMNLPIDRLLQDGDEFIFKLTSSDKWVNVVIHFHLENNPEFTFSAKSEMRISGYFQNSHFFLIINKLIINIWNENARNLLGIEEYYTITKLKFRNKKIVQEILDQSQQEASIIEMESPRNGIIKSIRGINKEMDNIDVK